MPNRPRHVVLCDFGEFWVYDGEFWVCNCENWLDESVDVVMLEDPPWAPDGQLIPRSERSVP